MTAVWDWRQTSQGLKVLDAVWHGCGTLETFLKKIAPKWLKKDVIESVCKGKIEISTIVEMRVFFKKY